MALRVRSITGVAVIPFGLIFPHGKLVAGDSPLGRTLVCQRIVAELPLMLCASTAYTVSVSVATYRTFLFPCPGIPNRLTKSAWPPTRPATADSSTCPNTTEVEYIVD